MSQHSPHSSVCGSPANSVAPALIVYNFNGRHTLPALLAALKPVAKRSGSPLLVVDDASDDASPDFLKSQTGLESLLLQEREGSAGALNRGFARFPRRDVIRLHSQILPDGPDWLDKMLQAAAALPRTGVIGVRLITPDGRILSEGRRLVTGLGLTWQEADRLHLNADRPAPAAPVEVDSVAGDLAYYRRDALDAAGGLDPGYWPCGLEDDDFCFAARSKGFDVHVLPDVRALSLRPAPLPEGARVPALEALLAGERELRKAQTEYWTAKWGWDPLLPDLNEVRRLYGRSRVCWAMGDILRWDHADPFPAVDLCMVTWNGAANLERCLQSLARTDYPAERLTLWLVDNASTDATPEILPRLIEDLPFACRLIRLDVNTGGVVGLNWAFAQGNAPLVAKLDDDIVLPPHWLRRLADVFRRRPYAGVAGPRIVDDSPAGLVQCADYAYYPFPGGREGEYDDGSAAFLARVTHVRGCCNLYRRDVLERCGSLDIRFSPSQWDDPDHHMALLTAGYEVIYDGSVRVAHKCVTGAAGGASLGHAAINKAKMLLKWGQDSPQVLECALLLSREGRFLPDSGDCSALLAKAPSPSLFPRRPSPELTRHTKGLAARIPGLSARAPATGYPPVSGCPPTLSAVLTGTARQLVAQAEDGRAEGKENAVSPQLRAAVSCAPHDPLPLLALADVLEDAGTSADVLRRRAGLLQATLHPPLAGTSGEPERFFPRMKRPLGLTCEPSGRFTGHPGARILFCLPHRSRLNDELADLLEREGRRLCARGFQVRVTSDPAPPPGPWDIAHFWTLDTPHETLLQMKAVRCAAPGTPLVLTPLWRDPAGQSRAEVLFRALRNRLNDAQAAFPPEKDLDLQPASDVSDGPLLRRLILELADALLLCGREEASLLAAEGPLPRKALLSLPPLTDFEAGRADPQAFKEACGLDEFVLAVAPFHPLANQAVLLAALAPLQTPLVMVGRAQDREYLHACRHLATRRTLFVSELDNGLLASAFAAARVYALPQLGLPGALAERAALNAAMCGKPVVAAANGPEAWLLGRLAPGALHVCDPVSALSVREAVLKARLSPVPEPEIRRLETFYATEDREPAALYAELLSAGSVGRAVSSTCNPR